MYSYITGKISKFKEKYHSLRTKPDYYIFSALCVEAHFYKNPENVISEGDFEEIIVDGCNDGGADIILNDPDSENCDLIIGQSKFHKKISKDEIFDSFHKMVRFYNEMKSDITSNLIPMYKVVFLRWMPILVKNQKFILFSTRVHYHREISIQRALKGKFLTSFQIQIRLKFLFFSPQT